MDEAPISFDLLEFTDRTELTKIVESFCSVTGLAGGIVLMPGAGHPEPQNESELSQLRATSPEVVNASQFCSIVRSCEAGNMCCMASDLKNAGEANRRSTAVAYQCHMKLHDLMAPIRVCGRHVANVYLGQIRPKELKFETVRKRYHTLINESKAQAFQKVSDDDLHAALERLPTADKNQLKNYGFFVEMLANLISQRANRQAVIKMAVAASREVGVTLNLRVGLQAYLRYAIALLNGDTGSIFLIDPNNPNRLQSYALRWAGQNHADVTFDLQGSGIIAENARKNIRLVGEKAVSRSDTTPKTFVSRFNNRRELDAHVEEQFGGTRDQRRLESLIVVPICCGDQMLGTLDVGSQRENAFTADDEHVLRLFATVIGAYVWTVRQRQRLVQVIGQRYPSDVMYALVQEIPKDVMGVGCSIFVVNHEGHAELAASTEFSNPVDYSKITYKAGEGLTGWVFQRGQPLRISTGPYCRSTSMDKALRTRGVRWLAKYAHLEPLSAGHHLYYENRPFLAVAIRAGDGQILGVIRVGDRTGGEFSAEDETTVQMYADFLGHFITPPPNLRGGVKRSAIPKVFLGHGRNQDAAHTVAAHLRRLGLDPQRYEESVGISDYSFEVVSKMIRDSDTAIILYTGDDELKNGTKIGRRNVAHELGLAQGLLGPKRTLLLLESDVEKPTNVDGMQHIAFARNNVQSAFEKLSAYLERAGVLRTK